MRGPKYRPLDQKELAHALGRKGGHRGAVVEALKRTGALREIARIRKNRYILPAAADLVTGKLQIHQAGFGFLAREGAEEGDVFIAAENTGTAMNGDRVVARITRDGGTRGSGAAAKARKAASFASWNARTTRSSARLQQTKNFFYVVPDDPRLVHNVYVQPRTAPESAAALWATR